jgi:methylmalonyl-CoA/ethylmalonyl-CoA epimerase
MSEFPKESAVKLNLHHVGIVVQDIAQEAANYRDRLGYDVKSDIMHDPHQTAFVQFFQLAGDAAYVELVSPDGPQSKLSNALKKGGGLNHLCYSTDDIETACAALRAKGMYILQAPVAAVAFEGRRIAWLMGRDMLPIELLEDLPQ